MVPDGDVGAQLRDEVDHRLRLGLARRAGAGVLAVAGLTPSGPHLYGKLRLRSTWLAFWRWSIAWPSGFIDSTSHSSTPSGAPAGAQLVDDRGARRLVAMDHADHEHAAAARRSVPLGDDRPAEHRRTELDDGRR